MAELKSRLRADLTPAMKSQDKLRTATLRMVLAAIQIEEVSGKQARDLSDDEVIKVLARESRKRGEAAEIYTQNGRGELAANEHAEARMIDEYLPTPLTEAELADVADTAIAEVAETIGERPTMKQMGLVMKAATAIAAGKADGARLPRRSKTACSGPGTWPCRLRVVRPVTLVGMTKFGYTLMTEQSGPKILSGTRFRPKTPVSTLRSAATTSHRG